MNKKVKNVFFCGSMVIPAVYLVGCQSNVRKNNEHPNVILIFVDDMGYGDLGCYGSTVNRTPNLDKMAKEGIRFTDFHVAASVCTPSRAALMTGCYPKRIDMAIFEEEKGPNNLVLFPGSLKGLNPSEITIAEILKEQEYRTACIGKWHLGDQLDFLPTRQGFDYYYGIPYSNDMGNAELNYPPLPIMRNEMVIEAPADQNTLTKRYTEEVIDFIQNDTRKPFFIFLSHSMVHVPLYASDSFRGKSKNGLYGDAVEEIDWSTGSIMNYIKEAGLDDKTLIIFTSDNGGVPRFGGSNLPLSGIKGSILEGGFRVPFIARWPSKIQGGKICTQMASTLDILPTLAKLCNAKMPSDIIIDGKDISPMLLTDTIIYYPRIFYYYSRDQLQAVRWGDWKLILPSMNKDFVESPDTINISTGELYNLKEDIGEKNNIIDKHPDIVRKLIAIADSVRIDMGDDNIEGKNVREAGYVKKQILP